MRALAHKTDVALVAFNDVVEPSAPSFRIFPNFATFSVIVQLEGCEHLFERLMKALPIDDVDADEAQLLALVVLGQANTPDTVDNDTIGERWSDIDWHFVAENCINPLILDGTVCLRLVSQ